MSGLLWKLYLQDDLVEFQRLLESSNNDGYPSRSISGNVSATGSGKTSYGKSGRPGDSPTISPKVSRSVGLEHGSNLETRYSTGEFRVSKHTINSRDKIGKTILHHVSSSSSSNAIVYARTLLQHTFTDIYLQDLENGWTCLHRAFYFGNISIARLILARDLSNSRTDNSTTKTLIKVKDKEGNAPFDLYALSVQNFPLTTQNSEDSWRADKSEEEQQESSEEDDCDAFSKKSQQIITPSINGNEVLTFGSNRNVTLGFGDEDDRQFPERVTFKRSEHLIRRFHREQLSRMEQTWESLNLLECFKYVRSNKKRATNHTASTTVRNSPIIIHDVQMSKLHTAVLTADPESNLYMCGYGLGGRLGTGDESTQFKLKCLDGGSIAKKKVVAVALGLNHSLALTNEGEISSWGSNAYGQLGYALPKSKYGEDVPIQSVPRQIYGPLKREAVCGIAASRVHSVSFTSTSLYTFGKNEGQLGIVDADARSLQCQTVPRKVAISLFKCSIRSVSAIETATVCLLENHEVWVFANFGYARLRFFGETLSDKINERAFQRTEVGHIHGVVCKIIAGGNTLCALSNSGEIHTITISQRNESLQGTLASTTNPTKIRGAFSAPVLVWSAKKAHMAARDVSLDQDGSIILSTEAGTVWKREKRNNTASKMNTSAIEQRKQDFKFTRVPGLTRVAAVRSSAHGAYAAVRKGCDTVHREVTIDGELLRDDLWPLLSLRCWEDQLDRDKSRSSQGELLSFLKHRILESEGAGFDSSHLFNDIEGKSTANHDVFVCTSVSKLKIPVHSFMLASRSPMLRKIVKTVQRKGSFSMSGFMDFRLVADGKAFMKFHSVDSITIINFVAYLYTDAVLDVWNFARLYPKMAPRYRLVRIELMKIAQKLELLNLEPPVRQMLQPQLSMHLDIELAIKDPGLFEDADVLLQLADDEVKAHADLLCQRCPFFKAMFHGRAGGIWLEGRKDNSLIKVDLSNFESETFHFVLRYIYTDAGDTMFDEIIGDDFDDLLDLENLLDLALDVMAMADELMLDRLSHVCQRFIWRYVNERNICQLLNAIAPCSVTAFKDAALGYLCRNVEGILSSRILDEIDDYLLRELDDVVRASQRACMPFVRSGRAEEILYAKYPQLADMIKQEKRHLIDSSILNSKAGNHGQHNSQPIREYISDTKNLDVSKRKIPDSNEVDSREGKAVSMLSKEISNAETLFPMDDFTSSPSNNEKVDSRQPGTDDSGNTSSRVNSSFKTTNYDAERLIWPAMDGQVSKLSDNDQRVSRRFIEYTLGESPQSQPRGSPWGSVLTENKGTILKEIMAEHSTKHTSRFSTDALSRTLVERRAQGSFTKRISQKSRKKLQAEQHSQSYLSKEVESPSEPSKEKENPWQSSTKAIAVQGSGNLAFQAANAPKASSSFGRAISGSQLTMRQTIAHSHPASEEKDGSPAHISEPSRAVSSPVTPKRDNNTLHTTPPLVSTLSQSSQASRSLPKPQIQSIRHTPMPANTATDFDANYAISDILTQQQAEKESIRDAAAKRSLQEIQTEQEFQEWWDQESKKVMEEQQAAVAGPSAGRYQRGKGRREGNRKIGDKKGGREKRGSNGRGGGGGGEEEEKGGRNTNSKRGGDGSSKKLSNDSTATAAATATTATTDTGRNTAGSKKSEQKSRRTSQRRQEKESKQ